MTNKRRKSSVIIKDDTVDQMPEVDNSSYRVRGGHHPVSEKTKEMCETLRILRKRSILASRRQEIEAEMSLGGPGVLRNLKTD